MAHFAPGAAPDPDQCPYDILGMAIDSPAAHDSGAHCHQQALLMYCTRGVLEIQIGERYCLLPPTLAAWIPAGLPHSARASKPYSYRSLYFKPDLLTGLPAYGTVLGINALSREVIVRIAEWPLAPPDGPLLRLMQVLADELRLAPEQALSLPLPQDRRLVKLCERLLADPGDPATLDALAVSVGASRKTIHRLFVQQTGLHFAAWRQQLRIMNARKRLEEGEPVGRVAADLGYAQESAFIAMFRKATGITPGRLRRGASNGSGSRE
ncbi:MAG: helix-turn-helix transcriptional regulator [Paludibacterium sp.]|uniref:AraC family transcriptional regulator n=1 Tax=Paludibacterium sp. TaxID=1917523 RepID=UPI0025ED89F9|nr:helix-turn-helix transcriptional regulator [Paludibacterium sp.]MBV8046411.1 helix-turn-helix transcriptional regulator [Paludibacterium sp.]MBV8647973.1 helix-turn-helix transcriptional regulator [Paludibacterium sp.]